MNTETKTLKDILQEYKEKRAEQDLQRYIQAHYVQVYNKDMTFIGWRKLWASL